jgi:hypothetical protein
VYGHQAETSTDILEQLNQRMDEVCKLYWDKPRLTNTTIKAYEVTNGADHNKISSNLTQALTLWCGNRYADEYWRGRIGLESVTTIHWDATKRVMKQLPTHRRKWLSKQAAGSFASGKMMKNRNDRLTDHCPRCGQSEDSKHILRCRTKLTDELWEQHSTKIQTWMQEQQMDPTVQRNLSME